MSAHVINTREGTMPQIDKELVFAVLDTSRHGIMILNEQAQVICWNKWMEKTSRINRQNAIGLNLKQLFPEMLNSRIHGAIDHALNKGMPSLLSHTLNRHPFPLSTWQGQLEPIEQMIHISPLKLSSEQTCCSVQIDDVSAAVKRERLLRVMTAESDKARKAAEGVSRLKSEFIAIVSHELRTPLTSILGSLSLLINKMTSEISSKAQPLVNVAHRNTERLLLIINDILDIEKIESGKMDFYNRQVALSPLVTQTIEANRSYGENLGVRFTLHDETQNIMVNVDENRLMQVMANLLSNAAKFSPAHEDVVINIVQQNPGVRISVADKGPGIPDDFHPHIFQKFVQADSSDSRQKGGTGLGLSISKAIIEKLGGEIGFETDVGVGTIFYFDLPVCEN